MQCKEYQEVLLTDYLDDQLSKENQHKVDAHLSSCQACREFVGMARKAVVDPFENSQEATPPEDIWNHIQEEIAKETSEERIGWLERLREMLLPRPALALATLAGLVIMMMVLTPGVKQNSLVKNEDVSKQQMVSQQIAEFQADLPESIDYTAYLFDDSSGVEEYGTLIEEYFL